MPERGRCAWLLCLVLGWGCVHDPPDTPARPLRVAMHSAPLSLDPHRANEALTFSVLRNVFEGLTGIGPNGGVEPILAARWENPDDLRWRFVLRDGIRFHDGRLLTAQDVVASLERARHHPETDFASYLVEVATVEAIGPRTVEITTEQPYPILLNKLAFVSIVPHDAPAEITEPLGTGPYRLRTHEPGQAVRLEAFDGHWAGPARVDSIELLPEPDADRRLAALVAGHVDLAFDLRAEHAEHLTGDTRLVARDGLQVEYLALRTGIAPFDDPRLREAIDLALDRERLVNEQLGGFATALGQLVGLNVFGHDPTIGVPAADIAGARRLVNELALPPGFRIRIEARQGRDPAPLVAQLEAVGLAAEAVVHPWTLMWQRLGNGSVDAYYGGMLAVSADASDIFDTMLHSFDPTRGYGRNNHLEYRNEALDRLLEERGGTLVMLERRSVLQQAMRMAMADRAFLPLYSPHDLYGVHQRVDWTPRLDGMLVGHELGWRP